MMHFRTGAVLMAASAGFLVAQMDPPSRVGHIAIVYHQLPPR